MIRGQGTRQNDPVTSGERVPRRFRKVMAGRSEEAQATVYQKHKALQNRKMKYKA